MRVLVNAVAANMGGALRHLRGFAGVLGEVGREHEFWLCIGRDLELPPPTCNAHLFRVSLYGSLNRQLYWHQVEVPRLVRRFGIEALISLLNFGPLRPSVPQITFQRNQVYFCPYYPQTVGRRARTEARVRRWLACRTMRASAAVVTPSLGMREMIRARYPFFPEGKFHVIPHGFDAGEFLGNREPLPERARRLLSDAGPGRVRLLYATHPAPYKGVEITLHALRAVRDAGVDACLFLTMEPADWPKGVGRYLRLARDLGLENDVLLLGRIPQNAMASVYEGCDLFVFPSLCESFGFPMLEAMSAGLPVVASGTAVNREILGESALYYPPLDSRAAALEILRVAGDEGLRKRLSEASGRRMEQIDWGWKRHVRDVLSLVA
ncbi:MAG: glycosyltransferase family 4 protein [Nitrospinota bacterium]